MPPICLRTADKLHASDVVTFRPGTPETVDHVDTVDHGAAFLVRTKTNMWFVPRDAFVQVLAVSVAGIGYVSPVAA